MKILSFIIIITSFGIRPGYANEMINNSAKAYVAGNIVQIGDKQSANTINIGSVIAESARNVNVKAHVDGNIFVKTARGQKTVLSIGSYGGHHE